MPEALDRWQLLDARKLQRSGLTLREIADNLEVSFGAVCLGLYGDNKSNSEPDGVLRPQTGAVETLVANSPDGASEKVGGFPVPAAPLSRGGTGGEEGDQTSQPANVGGNSNVTAGETATLASNPDPAIEAERSELLQLFHPAQRFKLMSLDGQTLHENERVLTRLPSFFWRGTGERLADLRRRKPQWAHLKPMAVS